MNAIPPDSAGPEPFDVVCVGEGMIELSCARSGVKLGFGGDTLNTAIHLARSGVRTAFLTALGEDSFSADLRRAWSAEGLDGSLVLTHPTRSAGLYAIRTDDQGERTFHYWRDSSAARELFALSETGDAVARARNARILVFSLISLAILPPEGRSALLNLADAVRASGGLVAFDGNYRPRLWSSPDEARAARDAAVARSDIGFPTIEDEIALGMTDADQCARHWQALGCSEVIVKFGAKGCRLPDGFVLAPPRLLSPVDTSGAGDAFNAGYLAARLHGASPADCARAGHRLAGAVIMQLGAIPPLGPDIYAGLINMAP